MKVALVITILLLFTVPLAAEPMVVRTGEHDGFTRVVIDAGKGVRWDAEYTGSLLHIEINGSNRFYDLSSVYDRMKRDRIEKIDFTENTLELKIACDCSVSVFYSEPGMIVADIASPGVTLKTPILAAFNAIPRTSESPTLIPHPDKMGILPPWPTVDATNVNNIFQQKISQRIGALGTLGVLKLKIQEDRLLNTFNIPKVEGKISNSGLNNNDISTGTIQPTHPSAEAVCRNSASLKKIHDDIQIGDRNQTVPTTILDVHDIENIISNSTSLLHFGFGAESLQILDIADSDDTRVDLLIMISEIFEYGEAQRNHTLIPVFSCHSDLNIWKLLYNGGATAMNADEIKSSLLSLSQFPPQLKNILTPLTIEALKNLGLEDHIANILETSDRSADQLEAQARFDREVSEVSTASKSSKPASQPIIPVKDLQLIIEKNIESGLPTSKDHIAHIDDQIFQASETDEKSSILTLKAEALLANKDFYAALEAIELIETPNLPEGLVDRVFYGLVEKSDDITFLELSLDVSPKFRNKISQLTLRKIDIRRSELLSVNQTEGTPYSN